MVKITGVAEVLKNFEDYTVKEKRRIRNECKSWARKTMNDAIEMAPSDTGNLRRTAFFDFTRAKATVKSTTEIHFRVGFTAKYAASVHEIMRPSSGVPRTSGSKKGRYWDVGQPKFLEIPARRNLQLLNRRLRGI